MEAMHAHRKKTQTITLHKLFCAYNAPRAYERVVVSSDMLAQSRDDLKRAEEFKFEHKKESFMRTEQTRLGRTPLMRVPTSSRSESQNSTLSQIPSSSCYYYYMNALNSSTRKMYICMQ